MYVWMRVWMVEPFIQLCVMHNSPFGIRGDETLHFNFTVLLIPTHSNNRIYHLPHSINWSLFSHNRIAGADLIFVF